MQYAIKERQEGSASTGPFLRLTLSNRDGDLKAVFWSAPDEVRAAAKVGAVVEVEGETGEYRGERQLKLSNLRVVPPEQVRHEDLLPVSPQDRDQQVDRLKRFIMLVEHAELNDFLIRLFKDPVLFRQYTTWPAAVSYHHAWVGGLLDHSLEVAGVVAGMAEMWPLLNRDLLITGALLHDVGKLWEIDVGATFSRSTRGELVGHVVQGMEWLSWRLRETPLPEPLAEELLHMLASHHGQLEWGAVQVPRTPNAVALHLADLASARLTMVSQAVAGHEGQEPWTDWDPATRTRYWLGGLAK